jgi:hypothetical protein
LPLYTAGFAVYITLNSMSAIRIFGSLLAIFCIWGGAQSTAKLFTALTPKSQFLVVEGRVLEVRTHIDRNPGFAEQVGTNTKVFEVLFSYPSAGNELTMNTVSPLCTHCPLENIVFATGVQPSQLTKGKSVNVLVDRNNPSRAYLMLPSNTELLMQGLYGIIFIFLAPAFVWFFCSFWERKNAA